MIPLPFFIYIYYALEGINSITLAMQGLLNTERKVYINVPNKSLLFKIDKWSLISREDKLYLHDGGEIYV